MWDSLKHKIVNYIERNFSISANVSNSDGYNWWISAIYGSAKRKNRKAFWKELSNLASACVPNWLIGGDFNIIRCSNKHLLETLLETA